MIRLRALFFAAFFTLSLFPGPAAAAPQMAEIKGLVENRTVGGSGVSGREVELHQYLDKSDTLIGKTKTDAAGAFTFAQVKVKDGAVYALSTRYGEMSYYSKPFQLKEAGTVQTPLAIYEATDRDEGLRVQMHHIIFERSPHAFMVKEVLIVENPGKNTFLGILDNKTGRRAGFQIPLPQDAAGIEYAPPLTPLPAGQGKQTVLNAPLQPGLTKLILAYELPSDGSDYNFEKVFNFKTDALSVVLPAKGLSVKSDRLAAQTGATAQKQFNQLLGKDFAAGDKVAMVLSFTNSANYFKWAVSILTILALGAGLGIALKKKKRPAGEEGMDHS